MKLGSVTKLDNRNKMTSKKINDDVRSTNCEVIVIFPTYGQFGYSLGITFYLTKSENRTEKSLT